MTAVSHTPVTGGGIPATWAGLSSWLARFPLSVILLCVRFGIAAVFLNSAMLRVRSWEFGVRLFRDEFALPLISPETGAILATVVELSMATLLFFGFASRLATLPLLVMTAVIQFLVFPEAWTTHILWVGALLLILTRGPGVFSVDYVAARFAAEPRRDGSLLPYAAAAAGTAGVVGAIGWWLAFMLGAVGPSGLRLGCLFFADRCAPAAEAAGAGAFVYQPMMFWVSVAVALAGLAWLIAADPARKTRP